MRGNGDRQGLMADEYTPQELPDACEVIAWAAAQPWCTGKVGMMGISWGGFNALQVAALRPPALKAIVTPLLHRRPLRRRHPLQGRLPPGRELRLGGEHALLFLAPARPGAGRRPLARDVAEAAGEPTVPGRRPGCSTRPRRLLEARLGLRGLRRHRGGGAGRRRLARWLPQRPAAAWSPTSPPPVKGIVGPWIHKYPHFAVPGPPSASCRRRCAGGTAG